MNFITLKSHKILKEIKINLKEYTLYNYMLIYLKYLHRNAHLHTKPEPSKEMFTWNTLVMIVSGPEGCVWKRVLERFLEFQQYSALMPGLWILWYFLCSYSHGIYLSLTFSLWVLYFSKILFLKICLNKIQTAYQF